MSENLEIERKFLCNLTLEQIERMSKTSYKNKYIESIYIKNEKHEAIRVVKDVPHATLWPIYRMTSKRPYKNDPRIRYEDEHPILAATYSIFANSDYPRVTKDRYHIMYEGREWEIDVFEHEDLIIAEIEFKSIDEEIKVPDWAYLDVTDDPKYLNCNLAKVR